jgi:hypothetical protein
MTVIDDFTNIGSKVAEGPFFEEIYVVMVRLVSGLLFSISILFLFINPDLTKISDTFNYLTKMTIRWDIYLFFLALIYIMGLLSTATFDCFIYILSNITMFISKKTKKIDKLKDFFWIDGVLSSRSDKLYEGYKKTVASKLQKYFDLQNCSSGDIVRLSRILSLNQKMFKGYRNDHSFLIGKALFIFVSFLSIRFLIDKHFFIFFAMSLVAFYLFVKIRELTMSVRINYLDSLIVKLALNKENHNNGSV